MTDRQNDQADRDIAQAHRFNIAARIALGLLLLLLVLGAPLVLHSGALVAIGLKVPAALVFG